MTEENKELLEDKKTIKKRGRKVAYNQVKHTSLGLALSRLGKTDEEIAELLGISTATLYNWKKNFPEFLEAINEGKDFADAKVENSLYNRAVGTSIKEKHTHTEIVQKLMDIEGKDGKKEKQLTTTNKKVYTDEVEKELPGDVKAQTIWLTNRKRKDWKETRNLELAGKDGGAIETKNNNININYEDIKNNSEVSDFIKGLYE